jgi:transketolase
MQYNPTNPEWVNRDRFVLSAGHGCLLQYCYLYLTGYPLTMDDLKQFRQLDSITPGHPEYGLTKGIEVTTGPLGQGFGNGVGFAIAEQMLAARFNRPGHDILNYRVFAICSDGDMMEGISSEAASLAGHLKLGNLIYLYDDNHITIEGSTNLAFSEDVCKRFEAYGWQVQAVADGNDLESIARAVEAATLDKERPSLIRVRTHIAYGSPNKQDTASAHGAPLGKEEVREVKKFFGFDPDQQFVVPDEVLGFYRKAGGLGAEKEKGWNESFIRYKAAYPELAEAFDEAQAGRLPSGWQDQLPRFQPGQGKIATRKASGEVINKVAPLLPALVGGSADLSPSTDTYMKGMGSFSADDRHGRNMHFGIREHAMGAILNGMALSRGMIPFGGSFLIFSDYMRPAIRLAAIMQTHLILIFTHDSMGLGEDGTTHQPVEQLVSLRAIPGVTVIRPADANETVQAWKYALEHRKGPVLLVLTRQSLPVIDQQQYADAAGLQKGGYVLSEADKNMELILMATGSEVHLTLEAQELLQSSGVGVRVVSMPSLEIFERQDPAYKEQVLPSAVRKRIAVEAASPIGWYRYVTEQGSILGMHEFGKSAPGELLFEHFGFTAAHIADMALIMLGKKS